MKAVGLVIFSPKNVMNISAEDVRVRVREFWRLYCTKSASGFAEMYFSDATVLEADNRRVEPARLMLARRGRELFSPGASVEATLGSIDVQILDDGVAVASYHFHFRCIRTMATGKRLLSDNPGMRATQVFQRDEHGVLRILHEHLSSGAVNIPQELPASK